MTKQPIPRFKNKRNENTVQMFVHEYLQWLEWETFPHRLIYLRQESLFHGSFRASYRLAEQVSASLGMAFRSLQTCTTSYFHPLFLVYNKGDQPVSCLQSWLAYRHTFPTITPPWGVYHPFGIVSQNKCGRNTGLQRNKRRMALRVSTLAGAGSKHPESVCRIYFS